jgi:hypothetical protein
MAFGKMLARRLIQVTAVLAIGCGASFAAWQAAGVATYAAGSLVGR